MSAYKHYVNNKEPGQLSYVTTRCLDWAHLFGREEMRTRMCLSLIRDCTKEQAKLYSFVVMSNHLHIVIKPKPTMTISTLVQRIKANSVTRLRPHLIPSEIAQLGKQEGLNQHQYWQVSFRGNPLYTKDVAEQKVKYISLNPIRGGLVQAPEDYVWSSYHIGQLGYFKEDESINLAMVRDYYKGLLV